MEKIKVDVYFKDDVEILQDIIGKRVHCMVAADDPRYDLSQAIVISGNCSCGTLFVPEGKTVAAEGDFVALGYRS